MFVLGYVQATNMIPDAVPALRQIKCKTTFSSDIGGFDDSICGGDKYAPVTIDKEKFVLISCLQ